MSEKDFYQISLKLILKNDKGEVLILKAPEDKNTFAGFYDLPGGRIDDNEFGVDFLEIIKREVAEEIGDVKVSISTKPVALGRATSQKINKIRVLYIFFDAKYQDGDILISKEHIGYKWVDLRKIKLEDYFTSGILEGLKMYLA